jgi:hypothetical protein
VFPLLKVTLERWENDVVHMDINFNDKPSDFKNVYDPELGLTMGTLSS